MKAVPVMRKAGRIFLLCILFLCSPALAKITVQVDPTFGSPDELAAFNRLQEKYKRGSQAFRDLKTSIRNSAREVVLLVGRDQPLHEAT